jgi:hypothetical protein
VARRARLAKIVLIRERPTHLAMDFLEVQFMLIVT